jgi:hypothetical protein
MLTTDTLLQQWGRKYIEFTRQIVEDTLHCRMFSLGLFPGVWCLNATVSEHSAPRKKKKTVAPSQASRYERTDLPVTVQQCFPKRWHLNTRCRGRAQKKAFI